MVPSPISQPRHHYSSRMQAPQSIQAPQVGGNGGQQAASGDVNEIFQLILQLSTPEQVRCNIPFWSEAGILMQTPFFVRREKSLCQNSARGGNHARIWPQYYGTRLGLYPYCYKKLLWYIQCYLHQFCLLHRVLGYVMHLLYCNVLHLMLKQSPNL